MGDNILSLSVLIKYLNGMVFETITAKKNK